MENVFARDCPNPLPSYQNGFRLQDRFILGFAVTRQGIFGPAPDRLAETRLERSPELSAGASTSLSNDFCVCGRGRDADKPQAVEKEVDFVVVSLDAELFDFLTAGILFAK
jgi:hypothetical protein